MIGTESNHASSASKEILARLRAMRTASPVARASSFLERSCGLVHGFQLRVGLAPDLSDPVVPTLVETFSSMLILDLLVDTEVDPRIPEHLARYIAGHQEDGMFWFFEDTSLVPPDVDTVAVGLAALARSGAVSLAEPVASAAIDRIVSNQSSSGVIQVYFPPRGGRQERVDPVVCANVLYLLHLAGRGDEARATEDFVYSVLERRSYLEGTRYYLAPETFPAEVSGSLTGLYGGTLDETSCDREKLVSFLTDVMMVRDTGASLAAKITYHDSCSGLRELGVKDQPRKLLGAMSGVMRSIPADTKVAGAPAMPIAP